MTSPSPKPLCVRAHARASTFCKQERLQEKEFNLGRKLPISDLLPSLRVLQGNAILPPGQIYNSFGLELGQWSLVRLFNPFGLDNGQWSNFSILDLILDSGQTFQSLWSGVKLGPPRIVKFK